MTVTNANRRSIMLMAWDAKRSEPGRAFADCLRGAWAFARRMAKAAASFMRKARKAGGRVQLAPAMIRSPIARTVNGRRAGAQRDFEAALITARVGY